jgi:hypothetical protein
MLTPKEKAIEIFNSYSFLKEIFVPSIIEQKRCALIAVDEIIHTCLESMIYYWQQVKQEIDLL